MMREMNTDIYHRPMNSSTKFYLLLRLDLINVVLSVSFSRHLHSLTFSRSARGSNHTYGIYHIFKLEVFFLAWVNMIEQKRKFRNSGQVF